MATTIALAIVPSAQCATVRPMTTLHGAVVKLSDLFDGAGHNAARVLGPGPAPGARIVVEARQLGAIAREFGVDWHPGEGGIDRAVLERPGRILPRDQIMPVLMKALADAGAPADAELDVPAFAPPMVPADGDITPVITRLDYDAGSGRFTAAFEVADGGSGISSWRVSGKAVAMLDVPVPVARLLPGTVLRASDLRMERLPAGRVPAGAARTMADAVGRQIRYQAAPGKPVLLSSLNSPNLVARNARVLIVADLPGLSMSLQGRALEAGSVGEHVRVLNPASRAILDAEVIGEGRVRVDSSAPPIEFARPGLTGTEYVR